MSERTDFLLKTLTTEQFNEHLSRGKIVSANLCWEGYSESDVILAIYDTEELERITLESNGKAVPCILNVENFTEMVKNVLRSNHSQPIHFWRRIWPFSIIYRPKPAEFYKN